MPTGDLAYVPFNHQHPYPDDLRKVRNTINERDTIIPSIRYEGMIVYVLENTTTYQLKGGLTNEFWVILGTGVAGGGTGETTEMAAEDFYHGMLVEGDPDEYVIYAKGPKDIIYPDGGNQILYPGFMGNLVITMPSVIQGVGYAELGNEFAITNHSTGVLIITDNYLSAPAQTAFDFGGINLEIQVGEMVYFKGNGTDWEVGPNSSTITFSDTLNSVNAIVSIGPDNLEVISNVHNVVTGELLTFKETTTFLDDSAMDDSKSDGVIFVKSQGKYYFDTDILSGNPVSIEKFRIDTDDHTTLQRALDFIATTKSGYGQFTFRVPSNKRYDIDEPLLLNTFADVNLIGDGLRKSVINATAVMDAMVVLGNGGTTPFVGRCEIKGITFNGGGFADCCLDARGVRYSLYEKNEFTGLAANGEAVRLSGWVNTVHHNLFNNIAATAGLKGLRIYDDFAANSVNVTENSFSGYNIGLQIDDISTLVNINNNTFDDCQGTGIYITKGCRGISIENNYFELCGDVGLTITKGAPGAAEETWKGAIIAHHNYIASANWINGLLIKKNQFANCSDINNGLITLSGIDYAVIEKNFTYRAYTNKYFVDLKWEGSLYSSSRYVKIDHSPSVAAQFEMLVGLNADTYNNGHNNLIVTDRKLVPYAANYSMPIWNNPLLWSKVTEWDSFHEDDTTYRENRVWNLRGSASNGVRRLTLTVDSALAGKYFRVNWFHQSDTSTICNFDYKVDDIIVNTFSSTSTGAWVQGGRNGLIHVPDDAVTITFDFTPVTPATARKIAGFSIVPASYELNHKVALSPTRLTTDNYLVGGTPEGFQKAKAGRIAFDLFNGKVYKKTTSYDTVTGWVEVAATKASQGLVDAGTNNTDFVTPLTLATSSRIVAAVGATLLTTDGANLTGTAKDGAITKTVVTGASTGFPVTNGDVFNFNGANLNRTYSILKDRDSDTRYIQSYDGAGVGAGWVLIVIDGFQLDENGNAVIANTKKVGNGVLASENWTQYGNGANIYNVPTGNQHLFYQNGAQVAGITGDGKIFVEGVGKGIILKSPDGTQYELTVPNGGASVTITAV